MSFRPYELNGVIDLTRPALNRLFGAGLQTPFAVQDGFANSWGGSRAVSRDRKFGLVIATSGLSVDELKL